MGLRSKLNKMKSFLFDDEDEKEVKKVEKKSIKTKPVIEEKVKVEEPDIEELYFEEEDEPVIEEPKELKLRAEKKEAEFKFPEFNDDDFMVTPRRPEPIIEIKKEEPKRALYQGSKWKEEPKKFKPSPIISPIYGLLDKDGNTVKSEEIKKTTKKVDKDEVSLDDIRKKAYGLSVEDDEKTLSRRKKMTIEEAEKDMEKEEKALVTIGELEEANKDLEDDMILPNINFKEIDVDKERSKKKIKEIEEKEVKTDDDDDDDTKEQDLFNLIDSMYPKKGDEK